MVGMGRTRAQALLRNYLRTHAEFPDLEIVFELFSMVNSISEYEFRDILFMEDPVPVLELAIRRFGITVFQELSFGVFLNKYLQSYANSDPRLPSEYCEEVSPYGFAYYDPYDAKTVVQRRWPRRRFGRFLGLLHFLKTKKLSVSMETLRLLRKTVKNSFFQEGLLELWPGLR